jgi:hypothetical protein
MGDFIGLTVASRQDAYRDLPPLPGWSSGTARSRHPRGPAASVADGGVSRLSGGLLRSEDLPPDNAME